MKRTKRIARWRRLVKRIAKRLEQARADGEVHLTHRDIPIEVKGTPDEEADALQLIPELKPLENESRQEILLQYST